MTDPRFPGESTAEHQGQRDTTAIGFGIVALGAVGFLGAVVAVTVGNFRGDIDGWVTVAGGALLVVLAGSMTAAFGIRGRRGAASGFAGGCSSVALSIGLGVLLFLAAFAFLYATCFGIVMSGIR
jgi:hypothetical protein